MHPSSRKHRLIHLFLAGLLLVGPTVQASNQEIIEQLLAQDDAPFGVVFEIVERDPDALQWAIPAINRYVQQLRKHFPDIGLEIGRAHV